MKNCIFCKIIAGELPSTKLYEDDLVYAFLDISPINPGHLLVIPKEHYVSSSSIPEETAGRMFHIGSRFGVAFKRALESDGFNLHLADGACAGQVVMHAHLHVIPRDVEDGFHWNWRQVEYGNDSARNEIAEKIMEKMKK
jgi:histidine triad (HIT) family protein